MYKIIRTFLFLVNPETIHHLTVSALKLLRYIPFGVKIVKKMYEVKSPLLEREVFGITFKNPVGMAAGFDKNCEVYDELAALGFGFVEVGTITPKGQLGNPKPRLFRLKKDSAIINRMGFNNKGVAKGVAQLRKRKTNANSTVIVGGNMGKNTLTPNEKAKDDYLNLFRKLYDYVDYFVVNVSCPNIKNMQSLQNSDSLSDILEGIIEFRKGQGDYRPVLLKISPDLTFEQIDESIELMKRWNLDGIVATNTTRSREFLESSKDIVENIGNGGLSGKPLTKRSLEVVRYVNEKCEGNFPIIGVGGIMSSDDAVAMLEAGASLIQVYSGLIYNGPSFVKEICTKIIEVEKAKLAKGSKSDS